MIDEESRSELITYREDQAKSTVREAEFLLQNDMLRGSMNRMYYSMFYMLQALSLKYQFESSKHTQLLGWFNKTFIHTGKIDVKFSKIITKAYNLRTKGDYATVFELDKQELLQMFGEMTEFIREMEQFLKAPLDN
ncbi:MAG: HEPN domain-containing protein [Bacteroidales bacterium]|nr:HEPN domain-containing protein [Bacteroidales bacterium]